MHVRCIVRASYFRVILCSEPDSMMVVTIAKNENCEQRETERARKFYTTTYDVHDVLPGEFLNVYAFVFQPVFEYF